MMVQYPANLAKTKEFILTVNTPGTAYLKLIRSVKLY